MSGHLISCSEQPWSLDQCFVITFTCVTFVTNVTLYYAVVQYIHHTFRQQDLEARWTTESISVADLSQFIFLESFSGTWCDSGKCQTSHIWWRTASSHLHCSSLPLESLQACTHTQRTYFFLITIPCAMMSYCNVEIKVLSAESPEPPLTPSF